jgi:hypothetical protein
LSQQFYVLEVIFATKPPGLGLNRVKIQYSKKPLKFKQVNLEAIQINFFLPSYQFFIFLALQPK